MIKDKVKCQLLLAEMIEISQEVWQYLGKNNYGGLKPMPPIEGKQGGSSGCFYWQPPKVAYRYDTWNKMELAEKRLICIHELYHATTHNIKHKNIDSMFGLTEYNLYKRIYGNSQAMESYKKELDIMLDEIYN